jgi:hypothetical protein
MSENVFKSKETKPDEEMIRGTLGANYAQLENLRQFLKDEIGETTEEWKYYGQKLGWTLKTFLKKRNLFFIGMYEGYFNIAFVFGDKAVNRVLDSEIDPSLKKELAEARKYAEGRGISIKVDNPDCLDDIEELIRIKVSP